MRHFNIGDIVKSITPEDFPGLNVAEPPCKFEYGLIVADYPNGAGESGTYIVNTSITSQHSIVVDGVYIKRACESKNESYRRRNLLNKFRGSQIVMCPATNFIPHIHIGVVISMIDHGYAKYSYKVRAVDLLVKRNDKIDIVCSDAKPTTFSEYQLSAYQLPGKSTVFLGDELPYQVEYSTVPTQLLEEQFVKQVVDTATEMLLKSYPEWIANISKSIRDRFME